MADGGELHVGASRSTTAGRDRIEIWISDEGHGIADDDLPHIFEPFYSTKPEGSGLGLALVYRVLQDHGGHVEVRSAVGEGTTFTIALPATPHHTTAPSPSPTRRP
jgi:signal transduction histidine kinase